MEGGEKNLTRAISNVWRNSGREVFSLSSDEEDDGEALKWAALEKLPTFVRIRTGILSEDEGQFREIDVKKLGVIERRNLVERLVKTVEEDNEKFLLKLKERIDRVGINLPTIEVRFEHLNVDVEAYVGGRSLPTILNFFVNIFQEFLNHLQIIPSKKMPLTILHDVSGIIQPSRMTLLLGPPNSGKTTLLLALAGKLDPNLKVSGIVTYNGHGMDEFVPQRTSAYTSQHDLHIGELTVRETLAFSARCQGVGPRYEMLTELSRREKEANIKPDPDLDIYMKSASLQGQKANAVTEYVLKILGLEVCADTLVGDEMLRGISGGQKKRVTTGEMLVGPARALFMDEISTGLDSSTTFQIVNSIKQYIHILQGTCVISLLQPAPETYDLFDDIILQSDGQIVYQGPRENVLEFFEHIGFKCPDRKGVADFLQEVTSRKDQEQYWTRRHEPYGFVTAREFAKIFQSFHVGRKLEDELSIPFDKAKSHPAALATNKYGVSKKELLKALISREYLLMKRNSFVYIFKMTQLIIMAFVVMMIFLRSEMSKKTIEDGVIFMGALFFTLLTTMFNGFAELAMTIMKLPPFYKQRDLHFFPAWAFALPTWILKIPITFIEVGIWVFTSYYVIGFDPNVGRLFKMYLLLLCVNQTASGLFRLIAALGRNMIVANTFGSFALLAILVLGGFILSRDDIKKWWIWGYWASPLMYGQNAIAVNEFLGDSWRHEMKAQGIPEDRLELLKGVGGAFRPGVLTALMGVSGAGKTTLMDVLAGRKTGGYIEGRILVSGYPKKQETFARVAGYCEQTDVHSPHVTVYESLNYSAWLRLPHEVDSATRKMFVNEIMELVELTPLREALVGLPSVSGLSTEQRKRLTIAVELVANPSIIFMDEPTSGLDARAAAIVMRTVRNTVDTGRTVVCTIHQPSIDIFDAFDELFLLKRGGEEIYVGPLGHHSLHLIAYFEGINGVNKIKDGYNPATWMLEVTSIAQEAALEVDFAQVYKNSELYRRNKETITELSTPPWGSKDLCFATQYSQSFFTQCMACLWKQHLSYWRNPPYTAMRFLFTTIIALLFGTIFWHIGSKRGTQQDIFNAMGSMYSAVIFVGVQNATSVQPVVAVERTVFYREKAAGMYSALPYAFGQVVIELPYILVQSVIYGVIVYSMIGFEWTVAKFFWYLFFMYCTFLYFTYYGMMTVAVTPNHSIAAIVASAFYAVWNLFSGFIIPKTRIPLWWRWYVYICPVSWTLYGLVASQFGDIQDRLDTGETVKQFVVNYFDFRHDFVGYVGIIVAGIAVLFGFIFAFSIKAFNFQNR
ncbi:pleiotropic drug resistance protein 1-like isoform X2 [Rhododendron vialii]|uniref:pleiotropic drug resistance protein 1-like isoform X2 n=1 Tax=Rhododendron vialii TaxID=182163 RepID=UPI00265E9CC9|nr:pleiotropic drug resistance protein 1-like isoform X2 [Rhododendron vialii]